MVRSLLMGEQLPIETGASVVMGASPSSAELINVGKKETPVPTPSQGWEKKARGEHCIIVL